MSSRSAGYNTKAVILMAKPPVPGLVKTRLTPDLKADEAAELYRCFLQDTAKKIDSLGKIEKIIAVDIPLDSGIDPIDLYGYDILSSFLVLRQGGGDLGERLARLSIHAYDFADKYLFLGADSPDLPIEYIEEALMKLDESDIVIGPCDDGGFYLIGCNGCFPRLFTDVRWSTLFAMADTIASADKLALRVQKTPQWHDIDTLDDFLRLSEDLFRNPKQAPLTASFIAKFLHERLTK